MKHSRRYRLGSNQYKKTRKGFGVQQWFYTGVFISIFWLGVLNSLFPLSTVDAQGDDIKSPVPVEVLSEQAVDPTPTPAQVDNSDEQKVIEAYIKTIFGPDGKTAVAVSRNECGPTNASYPRCQFKTPFENSVGLFQINIQSEYAKVHYDRIPGDNLGEKIEWLMEPQNNVLMAYWIYSKSGWHPWTAYSSGNYLKDM